MANSLLVDYRMAVDCIARAGLDLHIMGNQKSEPIFTTPTPKVCPICEKPSYSSEGIHPQCAVIQADAPRRAHLAAEKKAKSQVKNKPR